MVLSEAEARPLYQRVARKALHLREIGLSQCAIARRLDVDDRTAAKATRWLQEMAPGGARASALEAMKCRVEGSQASARRIPRRLADPSKGGCFEA